MNLTSSKNNAKLSSTAILQTDLRPMNLTDFGSIAVYGAEHN
jgi:hypothetical protein